MTGSASNTVDLTNCDREPIHLLGAIQPFGFLITVRSDWTVLRTSANIATFLGREPAEMHQRPLADFFSAEAIHTLRNRVTMLRGPDAVERMFHVELVSGGPRFDIAVHFSASQLVIEAEPASEDTSDPANQVRMLMARLSQVQTMSGFLREAARQVRALTGFDRVMIYRFDHTGSGEVVAEALKTGVDSFFGLHYPASDIPAQARALYLRNIFRIISDVDALPVPLTPALDEAGASLDQSLSILRSVSPIHIEYLKNMGVRASLSISIIVEGRLWGLFACHHYAPLLPSFAQRSAAELYGQVFSFALESRERRDASQYEERARSVSERMMAAVADDAALMEQAEWLGDMIFDIIPADGVGVFIKGSISLSGLTPERAQFGEVVSALNRIADGQVYTTDRIQGLVPSAEAYAHIAAGMLAIPLSRAARDYVLLFRSEQLRTVRWAGNPEKAVEYGPNGQRLTPRKSFEEWSQLVKGSATPFTKTELGVARALRTSLLEVVLRLSEDAGQERQRASEQQKLLIAELNHRVRNILGLIRGLISQGKQADVTTESFVATLESRIQALARAHEQITTRKWGPSPLAELIHAEAGAYLGAKRDKLVLNGPAVLIDPAAFTVVSLLFHEMITNAAKYGALSDNGTIRVSWEISTNGSLDIHWIEAGGPPVTAPKRRGFGSTIIERSIPFELNGTADIRYHLSGVEGRFSIPARHVSRAEAAPMAATPVAAAGEGIAPILAGKRVLLVEDSMLVALDAEDALRALGAADIVVAPSLSAADAALREPVDVAVLDYNLGRENVQPLAARLIQMGCPFVLATGYGEDIALPEKFRGSPIVTKPYTAADLARAFARL